MTYSLFLLALGTASAAPVDISHQVRVMDANGEPLNGPMRLEVRIVGDNNPADADVTCYTHVSNPAAVDNGYASLILSSVPDTCFDAPSWTAVFVGDPAVEVGPRSPVTSVPLAAHASTASVAATATAADSVNGVTFGQSGAVAADIKAYIDSQLCRRTAGTWSDTTGCDPNMVVGTGTFSSTSCPAGYRVCSVPEAMLRAPNTTISGWHWAVHESSSPTSGNIDLNGTRYSFPYCPSGGDAPLIHFAAMPDGNSEVESVICYTGGYQPVCCR